MLNNSHRKTLAAIFANPVSPNIRWAAIEALFVSIGCGVSEGAGSRVSFYKDGAVGAFHRPHPGKEAKQYQVREARNFLVELGEAP